MRSRFHGCAVALCLAVLSLALATAGCGSKIYKHAGLASGSPEAARVVVVRLKEFKGGMVPVNLLMDGEKLVRLRGGRYCRLDVVPGEHSFDIETKRITHESPDSDDVTVAVWVSYGIDSLELEPGTTCYLLVATGEMMRDIDRDLTITLPDFGVSTSKTETVTFEWVVAQIDEEYAQSLLSEYLPVGP